MNCVELKWFENCYRYGSHEPVRFLDVYGIMGKIGAGCLGTVYEGVRVSDGTPVAVKVFSSKESRKDEWMIGPYPYEVDALRKLVGVPGVIQFYDYFVKNAKASEDDDTLVLVMERMIPSRSLGDFMGKCGRISENVVKLIFKQLVEAFMHCAEKKVYHLDAHLNNILINPKTGQIKLVDFGHVAISDDVDMKMKKIGNYFGGPYLPHGHSKPSQLMVLTLGDHLCTLLTNSWVPDNINDYPPDVSSGAKDLVAKCMQEEPKNRPTFQEILADPWLQDVPDVPMDLSSLDSGNKSRDRHSKSSLRTDSNFNPVYSTSKPLEHVFDL